MRRHLTVILFAAATAVWAAPSAADPIRLTGYGSGLTIDTHNSPSGWFQPAADTWYWFFTPATLAWNPPCPCPVDSVVNVSNHITGWIPGGAHLGDVIHPNVMYFADINFDVDPARVRPPVRFALQDAPDFAFSGTLVAWDMGFQNVLFTQTFYGWGSTRFDPNPRMYVPNFRPVRVLYQFDNGAPVPEPATLFLFGAGLTGAGWRKFSGSRRARS